MYLNQNLDIKSYDLKLFIIVGGLSILDAVGVYAFLPNYKVRQRR